MSTPRRPPVPGSARRGRDEPASGAVPRAGRAPGPAPGARAPRTGATRAAAARSGPVPKVGASRPANRGTRTGRPATPPRGTARLPVPRMFTVRAMVFSLVLLVAFVLVYPTLSSYLHARADVEQLRAERDAAAERNADLEADLARWDDPAYVIAQARERLSFVMPGETAFVVVDPETVPEQPVDENVPTPAADDGATRPWYTTVWESVEVAGSVDLEGRPIEGAEGEPADGEGTP